MKDLTKEINESIAKNLPQQVGEVLKERLNLIPKLEHQVLKLEETKEQYSDLISNHTDHVKRLKTQVSELTSLKLKREELDNKERNLKIEILEIKLAESEKRTDLARDYTFAVFKNPTFKTVEQHHGMAPVTQMSRDYNGDVLGVPVTFPTNNTVETKIVQED